MKKSNPIWSNVKKTLVLIGALTIVTLIIFDWFALWEEQKTMIQESAKEWKDWNSAVAQVNVQLRNVKKYRGKKFTHTKLMG